MKEVYMNNYTEELKRILKSSELIAESLNSSNINSIHYNEYAI